MTHLFLDDNHHSLSNSYEFLMELKFHGARTFSACDCDCDCDAWRIGHFTPYSEKA